MHERAKCRVKKERRNYRPIAEFGRYWYVCIDGAKRSKRQGGGRKRKSQRARVEDYHIVHHFFIGACLPKLPPCICFSTFGTARSPPPPMLLLTLPFALRLLKLPNFNDPISFPRRPFSLSPVAEVPRLTGVANPLCLGVPCPPVPCSRSLRES